MIKLRKYQQECIEAIKDNQQQGKFRQLISLPTGSGKTVIFASLIKELNVKTLIIAHTLELLMQAKEKIEMISPGISVGIVDGHNKEFSSQIVIASIQSASIESNLNRLRLEGFQLLIWDECHRSATSSARKVLDQLSFGAGTNKLLLGFTATAFRNDEKGLGEVFDIISYELSAKHLIDSGHLCKPTAYKIATDIDLSGVKTIDGDFATSSLDKVMNTPEMTALLVRSYQARANGLQAIAFSVTVDHAINIARAFNSAGITAEAVWGDMPAADRSMALENYRRGVTTVLSNCAVLTEGVDLPMCSCVIIAKPTSSKGLYCQMVGRGLRNYLNQKDGVVKKECVVLDFSSKNHNICSIAVLLDDKIADIEESEIVKESLLIRDLPKELDRQLKAAIISFDIIGRTFVWERISDGYVMRGGGVARIEIKPLKRDKYSVIFHDDKGEKLLSDQLNFEYSFEVAEDYAKDHKKLFALSDRDALWRKLPITPKQIEYFKKCSFKKGIKKLTRGQATDIIMSKVLFNRSTDKKT